MSYKLHKIDIQGINKLRNRSCLIVNLALYTLVSFEFIETWWKFVHILFT